MKRLLCVLVLAGCTSTPAEVETFRAIAPEYSAYVLNDPNLDEAQRTRRLRLVQTWRVRLNLQETHGK
jgi:hypothetical protein